MSVKFADLQERKICLSCAMEASINIRDLLEHHLLFEGINITFSKKVASW